MALGDMDGVVDHMQQKKILEADKAKLEAECDAKLEASLELVQRSCDVLKQTKGLQGRCRGRGC